MSMKKLFLLLTVLSASLTVWADGAEPKEIELTANERQLVVNNNNFAMKLFREAKTGESMLLSPLSITYALGMLNNGADGITRQEVNQVLGISGTSDGTDADDTEVLNAFCQKLLTESPDLDKETKVMIANNIYVNSARQLRLKDAFVEKAKQYYDATPQPLDYTDPTAIDVINQWASDHTEGMIKEVLKPDEFDPMTISTLLNAIYFKGAWAKPFNAERTVKAQFNGGKATAQLMQQEGEFLYAQGKNYESVKLPYGNGAYQLTVYLPNWGVTIDDVLTKLEGTQGESIDYKNYYVYLCLPSFETSTNQRLETIMSKLGMPNAFEGGAGYDDFCEELDGNPHNCFIGLMKQVAKIKLDEQGSEASAVTVIDMKDGAPDVEGYVSFIADRSFLYTISERSTGAIFFIGQYMGEPLSNPRHDISLTAEEKAQVAKNNDFAFDLFRKTRSESNMVLSPLSITYALGMLNNGAAGQTQQEINQVLGFNSVDDLNAFCRKMLDESGTLDNTTKVLIGNTVFVNEGKGYYLQDGFVEKANQFYDAEPQARDFADGVTRDVINKWGSDHTEGMIDEVLSKNEFKDYVASYLLNALYFKGAWTNKFNPAETQDELFNENETLPMMHQQWNEYMYTENDLYQAIRLPYGNKAFSMTVFLPREGKTIKDLLGTLNADNWHFQGESCEVDLKLPRFETDTDQSLKETMIALGMPAAFDREKAEFPYFCNYPGYIDMMKQVAKIKVNEEGTEAAAVTVIGYETTGMPRWATFHANRPFFYIISELSTNVIFFMGQFTGSTTSAIDTPPAQYVAMPSQNIYNLAGQRLNTVPNKGLYIQDGKLFK